MASKLRVDEIVGAQGSTVSIGTATFTGGLSGNLTGNVNSTGVTTVTSLRIGTGASISSPATNVLALGTNNVESVRIDSSGNLGINTANPTDKLTLLGKIQLQQDSSSNNRIIFRGTAGSSYRWNIDNYSTSNTFRIFREDDATAANGAHWAGITSTGDFQFNSGYGSAGTVYGCRAWINFNGTGTIATRASGNVSSISDQGTGDTIVNFTTALPDANFCWTATAENQGPGSRLYATLNAPNTTSSLRVITYDEGGTAKDSTYVFVAVFR